VQAIVERQAFAPGAFLTSGRIVNVLELNMALDGEPGAAPTGTPSTATDATAPSPVPAGEPPAPAQPDSPPSP
jgi:hypothetical protein